MKRTLIWFVAGLAIAGGLTYFALTGRLHDALSQAAEATGGLATAEGRIQTMESELTKTKSKLTGYTQYRDVLQIGERKLEERSKFLAAEINRVEGYTRFIKESFYGLPSNGAVEITYTAQYLFGYDVAPGRFDVVDTGTGIEIRIGRPGLVGNPAVTKMKHRILSEGLLIDEKEAIIVMQQEASKRALKSGAAMAKYPEVLALCEKNLAAFFANELARQGGVKQVPRITVVYR